MYLFWAVLGFRCCVGFSLVAASGSCSLDVVCGLLFAVASLVAEDRLWFMPASVVAAGGLVVAVPGLQSTGSIAVTHGLSCSEACGIFLDQGSNVSLLYWQANSSPLSHQRSLELS